MIGFLLNNNQVPIGCLVISCYLADLFEERVRNVPGHFSRRSWGGEDSVTSSKSICVGGYQLGIKLLFLSMDCNRCGVTQRWLFEGQEMSFSTRSSHCKGSWIREIASAKVLATVRIYHEVT